MKIYVLFALRNEQYPGQYGPVSLDIMTEADYEENPKYLENRLEEFRDSEEFQYLKIIPIEIEEDELLKKLTEKEEPLKGEIE